MEEDRVKEAVGLLQARGQKVTVRSVRQVLGSGSLRDVSVHLRTLVDEESPGEEPVVTATAESISVTVPPVVTGDRMPLLECAQQRLATAINREGAARVAWDSKRDPVERERLRPVVDAAQRERRAATIELERVQQAARQLRDGLPFAWQNLRYAQGELGQAMEAARQTVGRAQRQLESTREDLQRMLENLRAITGEDLTQGRRYLEISSTN